MAIKTPRPPNSVVPVLVLPPVFAACPAPALPLHWAMMSHGRVLIVSYAYPPQEGGVGMAAYDMALGLAQRGWQPHVLTTPLGPEWQAAGSRDPAVPVTELVDSVANDYPQALAFLRKLVAEFRPQVIVYHSWALWARRALLDLAQELAIPVLLRPHGRATNFRSFFNIRRPPCFGFKRWLLSFAQTRQDIRDFCRRNPANRLVFLDAAGSRFNGYDYAFAARNPAAFPHACIPNTFPAPEHNPQAVADFRLAHNLQGKLVFSCIAEFSRRKNQLQFVRQLRQHNSLGQNAVFVFIAPRRTDYAARVQAAAGNDPRFRFLFSLPRETVKTAITASDALFLYSVQEQQPLVLLEAMSCAVPWFAPAVGAVARLHGGMLLKRRSPAELARILHAMQDPAVRAKLGEQGRRQWLLEFSPQVVWQQWLALLNQALAAYAAAHSAPSASRPHESA